MADIAESLHFDPRVGDRELTENSVSLLKHQSLPPLVTNLLKGTLPKSFVPSTGDQVFKHKPMGTILIQTSTEALLQEKKNKESNN